MTKFFAEIKVMLKDDIRDPQGDAINTVLTRTGLEHDAKIRVGKCFVLNFSAENKDEAKQKLNSICLDVLSNPILEQYTIERFEKR